MPTMSNTLVIQRTRQWIESVVIAWNLCPFAKREIDRNSIRLEACCLQTEKDAIDALMAEILLLDTNPAIETTLLIFSTYLGDFFEYLDFVDKANARLVKAGYEGVYQLATFHPDYCFADVDCDDVTNYTNRSPYPMLHVLREESLARAIAYYGNTEAIPNHNMAYLRKLGLSEVKATLLRCHSQPKTEKPA